MMCKWRVYYKGLLKAVNVTQHCNRGVLNITLVVNIFLISVILAFLMLLCYQRLQMIYRVKFVGSNQLIVALGHAIFLCFEDFITLC